MKIGFCANMAAQDPQGIGDGWIEALAELGYDYVELPLAQMMSVDDQAFSSRVRLRLKRVGIPCEAANNFFPKDYRLTGPDADQSRAEAYARRALDRAAELGVKRVVFGSGGARNAPNHWPKERSLEQLTSFLQALAVPARERDIRIVIEPLNRLESNLINRLEECVALATLVGRDEIGVLADYYHMRMGFEPLDNIASAKGLLGHAHIARPLGRMIPQYGDDEPYTSLFSMFKAIGYDERVSVEANITEDFLAEAGDALRVLRHHASLGQGP